MTPVTKAFIDFLEVARSEGWPIDENVEAVAQVLMAGCDTLQPDDEDDENRCAELSNMLYSIVKDFKGI